MFCLSLIKHIFVNCNLLLTETIPYNEKFKSGEVKNISFVMNYFEHKAKYGYGYGYGKYGESYLDVSKKGNILKRIFNKIFRRK